MALADTLVCLCTAAILRGEIPLHQIEECRVGKRVKRLRDHLRTYPADQVRLEHSVEMILGSYSTEVEMWGDVKCICWFASLDRVDLVEIGWKRFEHLPLEVRIEQVLLGSLCGLNLRCIRFACDNGRHWILSNPKRVMGMLYTSSMHMTKYMSTSLGVVFMDLAMDIHNLLIVEPSLGGMTKERCIPLGAGNEPWRSIPWCGLHSFLYEATRVGSWETIKWLLCANIPLDRTLVLFCLHQDRYDILRRCRDIQFRNLFDGACVRWVWEACSPQATQWALIHTTSQLALWGNVCMSASTPLKLQLLLEAGLEISESSTEAAAMVCDGETFKEVISVARAWRPAVCMDKAKFNIQHCSEVKATISLMLSCSGHSCARIRHQRHRQ